MIDVDASMIDEDVDNSSFDDCLMFKMDNEEKSLNKMIGSDDIEERKVL